MDMLDFNNYLSDSAFDEFERDHIQAIYTYIEKGKVFDLTLFLTDFREGLLFYYTENRKIVGDYYYAESASIFFSQFLQHLFCYIVQEIEDSTYAEILLKMILNRHPSDFYYRTYDETGEITLWIDPNSEGTALIEAFRQADQEVVNILIETLKKSFRIYDNSKPIASEFEYYLFHENNLGLSALNIAWIKEKKELETCLFTLAEKLYGNPGERDFERFLFQIDAKGNSALMRAIERKNENLILLIFERFRELYYSYDKEIIQQLIQHLIQHQNLEGETILHKAIHTSYSLLGFLLRQSADAFGTIKSNKFSDFLLIENRSGETAFSLACQQGKREIIDLLFRSAIKRDIFLLTTANQMMLHQNNQGYSALMLIVEAGHIKSVQYLLNSLLAINRDIDGRYNKEAIFSVLSLRSRENYSLLQLAAKRRHWQILDLLLDSLAFISIAHKKMLLETINYAKESEHNLLTRLYREEVDVMQLVHDESRLLTAEEKASSSMRLALANKLVLSRFQTAVRTTIPAWQFIESRNWLQRTGDFFGIFCSSTRRQRRVIDSSCVFSDKFYQTSIPETPVELYKEALIHLAAVFTEQHMDSITQISLIRNSDNISSRERIELNRFGHAVNHYYSRHGSAILAELKRITAPNLELAFATDTTHIIVDSGNNLLVLTKDKLFCSSLLSATSFIPLSPEMIHNDLKNWLDSYFSAAYTLHPVNLKSVLQAYPAILTELVKPIISDADLLTRNYEGISGKTLYDLFFLNKQPIDLEKLSEDDFLSKYGNSLNYRAEKFHKIFFRLSLAEKESLKKLLIDYAIRPMHYDLFSNEENEFLTSYGSKINNLLKKNDDLNTIQDLDILDLAIDAHEELLSKEYHLSSTEKNKIIADFRSLKNSLPFNLAKQSYTKAVAQLTVLLFPNAIQSLVNKDPWPLVTPIGLMAADSGLRIILSKLLNHPQVLQLFTQPLTNKIGNIISQSGRVPLIGTTLALYGLINAGKTLAITDKNDPNRPYYAHLFINNLATVGLMGAEVAISLPFWPVLGLFTALTSDQILTEGRRLHDTVLHLRDDTTHPLLKFYREIKLGLDIVDDDIKMIKGERQLFDNFINFLNSAQNKQNADIVAVTLPAIRSIDLRIDPHRKKLGCTDDVSLINHSPIYPETSLCHHPILIIDKKDNYSFVFGKEKTFCEKQDPFYTTIVSNFSLWVGTSSLACTLGQEVTFEASAETTGEGAAALLINKQAKETKAGNYTLLLPIDPNYVGIFTINFMRDIRAPYHASKKGLACDSLISQCIKKIRVLFTPLYAIQANDRSMETQLIINDQELRNITHHQGIQTIEYIITKNENFTIHNNQIPEQLFAFINDYYHLSFEENSMFRSAAGFQASLANVQKLTITLSENAWIAGRIKPSNEQFVIHHLKAENRTNKAILDIRQCKLCAISVGKNLEIISYELIMHILGNFEIPVLGINSHHGNMPFYRLLIPVNQLFVNHKTENVLFLSLLTDKKLENSVLGNIILISRKPKMEKTAVVFSGNYRVNGQICFARLLIHKYSNDWECDLEINASQFNDTSGFDLSALQKQNFNKISVLTQSIDTVKITHYLFYQLQTRPVVSGRFVNYQLKASEEGWVIILEHAYGQEETHCFIAENTTEIIIENIRYEIKPATASLLALNTADNSPLDVSHLIAPLKIEKSFSEAKISLLSQHEYQIGNLSLINFTNKNIYFADENLPFYYLKYALLLNKTGYRFNRAIDSLLVVDKPVTSPWIESQHGEGWMQGLNGVLLSGSALITTALGVSCFMLIKRFKRPSPQTVYGGNILPLLEIKSTSANSISVDKNLKKITYQKGYSNDKILLNTATKDCISDIACDFLEDYDRRVSKKKHVSQKKFKQVKEQIACSIQNRRPASTKQEKNNHKPIKGREFKEKKAEQSLAKKVFCGQKNSHEERNFPNSTQPFKQKITQNIKKQNSTTFFKEQHAATITHSDPMQIKADRNVSKTFASQKTTQHPRLTHQAQGSRSHNARDSLWTTPMNLNATLFTLNFCVRAVIGTKSSSTRTVPKKVQKGLDYVEKVQLESSGFKVGGKINNTFYLR